MPWIWKLAVKNYKSQDYYNWIAYKKSLSIVLEKTYRYVKN